MTQLFDTFFHMGLSASFVIVVVLIACLLLRGVPRKYCYALWLVVLFRLLCPVSFQSAFGLFSIAGNPVRLLEVGFGTAPVHSEDMPIGQNQMSDLGEGKPDRGIPEWGSILDWGGTLEWEGILASVWIAGIVVLAGYSLVRGWLLRRRLRAARRGPGGGTENAWPAWLAHIRVCEVEGLETAFIMGVVRPCIYLPAGLDLQTRQYIIAHEHAHLRRFDPFWRMLGFAALCLHWYNPFVWLAWFKSGRDMEMSCDEAVVHKLGACAKKGYSAALLSIASGQRDLTGKMLAFGKGETGPRIRNVLNYKKPALWFAAVMTAGVAALGVFLAADPPSQIDVEAAKNKEVRQNTDAKGIKKQQPGYGVWQADLTHDGKPETIRFDTKSLKKEGYAEITVRSSKGKTLFSKAFSTSHAGWGTLALYHDGNGDYLLDYNPYFGQGIGGYSYQLFSLSNSGKINTRDGQSIEFSAGMPQIASGNDIAALIRFADAVNVYWKNSVLLVSTDMDMVLSNLYDADGNAVAKQESENYYIAPNTLDHPMHYVERMQWTDFVLDIDSGQGSDTMGMRSRLKAVNRMLAKNWKNIKKE